MGRGSERALEIKKGQEKRRCTEYFHVESSHGTEERKHVKRWEIRKEGKSAQLSKLEKEGAIMII